MSLATLLALEGTQSISNHHASPGLYFGGMWDFYVYLEVDGISQSRINVKNSNI